MEAFADHSTELYFKNMLVGLAIILGAASVVAMVTGVVFSLVRRLQGGNKLAVISAGLAAPLLVAVVGTLGVFYDQEVDGPPPGMVLLGLLTMSAVFMPITFSISLMLVRLFPQRQIDGAR